MKERGKKERHREKQNNRRESLLAMQDLAVQHMNEVMTDDALTQQLYCLAVTSEHNCHHVIVACKA